MNRVWRFVVKPVTVPLGLKLLGLAVGICSLVYMAINQPLKTVILLAIGLVVMPVVFRLTTAKWTMAELEQDERSLQVAAETSDSLPEMLWKRFRTFRLPMWMVLLFAYGTIDIILQLFGIDILW